MNILIIGDDLHLQECKAKFGQHEYALVTDHREAEKFIMSYDITFDFIIDEEPEQFEIYVSKPATVFLNTTKISLSELCHVFYNSVECHIFGFNGLPTFLNRPVMEVSLWREADRPLLDALCKKLNTDYFIVDDRVGLVTPRVISMIINEAYYAVQEGTASREDIDKAMKLGTNYPFGPFEWTQRIGIRHVYELLESLYEDTRDERYKICPLLKKEYLRHV